MPKQWTVCKFCTHKNCIDYIIYTYRQQSEDISIEVADVEPNLVRLFKLSLTDSDVMLYWAWQTAIAICWFQDNCCLPTANPKFAEFWLVMVKISKHCSKILEKNYF